ncbi:MAG: hypothetical protein ACI4HI_00230 [Lachnospiraceae bacterium]
MKVAFVGTEAENAQIAMQSVQTMCALLQNRRQKGWLCERLQFINCQTGSKKEECERIQNADILVKSFDQSKQVMEHHFEMIPKYHEKTFYLVHNYLEQSRWNRTAIQRTCRIPEDRLGILPYNQYLLGAHQRQNIPTYIHKNWIQPKQQEAPFFHELAWISEKIMQQAEQKKRMNFFR